MFCSYLEAFSFQTKGRSGRVRTTRRLMFYAYKRVLLTWGPSRSLWKEYSSRLFCPCFEIFISAWKDGSPHGKTTHQSLFYQCRKVMRSLGSPWEELKTRCIYYFTPVLEHSDLKRQKNLEGLGPPLGQCTIPIKVSCLVRTLPDACEKSGSIHSFIPIWRFWLAIYKSVW